jgi:hypothetical protein
LPRTRRGTCQRINWSLSEIGGWLAGNTIVFVHDVIMITSKKTNKKA